MGSGALWGQGSDGAGGAVGRGELWGTALGSGKLRRCGAVPPVGVPAMRAALTLWLALIGGAAVTALRCPDGASECPQNTTCCGTASGAWGCCPMPEVRGVTWWDGGGGDAVGWGDWGWGDWGWGDGGWG